MTTTTALKTEEFGKFVDQLSQKSINHYYNPYHLFAWPEHLPEQAYWMSIDLLSIYGTSLMEELSEHDLQRLSKWESINFYSLNVHGIRELLIEVVNRIHTPGFELTSGFFHHFIGEENEHMWFFSEFCRRYADKIYSSPSLKIFNQEQNNEKDKDIENFIVFSRILIFEEIVDFYNVRMANDETLHLSIRQLNSVHHQDEARHIAFGRRLILYLYQIITIFLFAKNLLQTHSTIKMDHEHLCKSSPLLNMNLFLKILPLRP